MKVRFVRPRWYTSEPTLETNEGVNLLDGVWREAANLFIIQSEIRKARGKTEPLGIQPFLNDVITQRFLDAGWLGEEGRFTKGQTWFRITFRHQMSLGSDFYDAIRLPKAEGIQQCVILAADDDFLKVITPRDWRSLCSFSKVSAQMSQMDGSFTPPLLIGELKPNTELSPTAHGVIYGSRLR
ncbi:hypothetical protein MCEMRE130_00470 [Candidatus Nanopelagicaceae bacterium]